MSRNLISFGDYKKFREQRQHSGTKSEECLEEARIRAVYTDLFGLVQETERLVKVLGNGAQRELAAAVANNKITDQESLFRLSKTYERLSWRLHGQLRYMTHGAQKK